MANLCTATYRQVVSDAQELARLEEAGLQQRHKEVEAKQLACTRGRGRQEGQVKGKKDV
jgi:hypothetical protein